MSLQASFMGYMIIMNYEAIFTIHCAFNNVAYHCVINFDTKIKGIYQASLGVYDHLMNNATFTELASKPVRDLHINISRKFQYLEVALT